MIDGFDDFFDGDGMATEKINNNNERPMIDLVVSVSQISFKPLLKFFSLAGTEIIGCDRTAQEALSRVELHRKA